MELYEFQCSECDEIILLEVDKEPICCPYCGENSIDYRRGHIIDVVLNYTVR